MLSPSPPLPPPFLGSHHLDILLCSDSRFWRKCGGEVEISFPPPFFYCSFCNDSSLAFATYHVLASYMQSDAWFPFHADSEGTRKIGAIYPSIEAGNKSTHSQGHKTREDHPERAKRSFDEGCEDWIRRKKMMCHGRAHPLLFSTCLPFCCWICANHRYPVHLFPTTIITTSNYYM